MINIAICDDDESVINQIKKYIEEYDACKSIISIYNCGEELLGERKKFHVIFLDIDMVGIDGIETAKRIRKYDKTVKIIYITNFADYVNLAFQVHAFGYLNKPIKKEQIYTQLNEAIAYSEDKEEKELIEFITLEGVVRLAPRDIYYFEYINRKVKIKTLNNNYMLKKNITTVSKDMKEYGFLMPHKSFIVNLFYVKSIKGYDIFMMDGSIIPLSQKKSSEFREQFNIFLENHIKNM
ncbi:DNA-binding LytR/AlgR family response regulator [Clostridium tetanomorphum]|uniref:Stage 0 sporulation protein A homolog n=1 Tax=Clostridium tetanomorphum TaxID=1553 RepID=A0A923EE51_CLOTT|nr:LytTR family DNA-binding domain-containing protein [Clostridium tetanomorphum]KAJ50141.1 DNA-binding response regulator [Clostridium tetanomorphum DSM 665]KAJ50926.1 DNA-binding response regulator [Clostridium tetanomorphum DSM 665]MBC2399764.1 response regulator transcription factor [Clostridium tetanomorphum]MBP1864256.1 DNA-binding LytR/AlgR family response regulator [Clostridium tetanomorphum]NRS83703.1 DNA-binding LytR/AlgR family response regulator [Clostridium tetanomorphum]